MIYTSYSRKDCAQNECQHEDGSINCLSLLYHNKADFFSRFVAIVDSWSHQVTSKENKNYQDHVPCCLRWRSHLCTLLRWPKSMNESSNGLREHLINQKLILRIICIPIIDKLSRLKKNCLQWRGGGCGWLILSNYKQGVETMETVP